MWKSYLTRVLRVEASRFLRAIWGGFPGLGRLSVKANAWRPFCLSVALRVWWRGAAILSLTNCNGSLKMNHCRAILIVEDEIGRFAKSRDSTLLYLRGMSVEMLSTGAGAPSELAQAKAVDLGNRRLMCSARSDREEESARNLRKRIRCGPDQS